MTLRISLVAVCCSNASLSAPVRRSTLALRAAYDSATGLSPFKELAHSRQNLACTGFSVWHREHLMPEPPSGRGGKGSERWAETNRPGLAWSRTRSSESPVQLVGCRRSWLPHRASTAAGGHSRRCPYSRPRARAGVRVLGLNPSALLHC